MIIYNKAFHKEELRRYTTSMKQLIPIRQYTLHNGMDGGMRAVDLETGAGLRFTLLPDRAMGISYASYKGFSLSWIGPAGEVHPAYTQNQDMYWLNSFYGGLFTQCGLATIGAPSRDGDELLPLHGRISSIAAEDFHVQSYWIQDDVYAISAQGMIREASLFKPVYELTRNYTIHAGENKFILKDTIVNASYYSAPLMMLYHFNFGFPILNPDTVIQTTHSIIQGYDEHAKSGIKEWNSIQEPQDMYPEQCFLHTMTGADNGFGTATLTSPFEDHSLCIELKFKIDTLPYLTQWKNLKAGEYVLGLEPCNVPIEARAVSREKGMLDVLEPWEERVMEIHFSVKEVV